MGNIYLQRYAWSGPVLQQEPAPDTGLIVVIPCYHEPDILNALDSLFACNLPSCHVEVLIVVNHGAHETTEIKDFNTLSAEKVSAWIATNKKTGITFNIIKAFDLPQKHAGVGLARKVGMDEAVRRFEQIGENKGIIACFDADCRCEPGYLETIYTFYLRSPETNAAVVHFEHPLTGVLAAEIYEGIINYELHLRYYRNGLQFAKFPFSFHTIGSCMTVSCETYQKQGGMNKRKAGEDFYFLQKIFPLGNCHHISSATVYPSPRPSYRVPFGTGKAIEKFLNNPHNSFNTYNPKSFEDLRCLMEIVPNLYDDDLKNSIYSLPESILAFLMTIDFAAALAKIKKNSNSEAAFRKSFFQKFNGFTALKFIHFARDNYYPEIEILEAANWILAKRCSKEMSTESKNEALQQLRLLDKSS